MSDDNSTYDVFLNPLLFPEIDRRIRRADPYTVDYDQFIRDLTMSLDSKPVEAIEKRYQQLTKHDAAVFVVPGDVLIIEKLILPLRAAKQAFCLGNFLGCIALCGLVSEMATIFLFDVTMPNTDPFLVSPNKQKKIFGSTFEKLGQERRIDILEANGLLNKGQAEKADKIREIRRAYLHILNKEFGKLEDDAEEVYSETTSLVSEIVGLIPIDGGKVTIPPHLQDYLNRDSDDESQAR